MLFCVIIYGSYKLSKLFGFRPTLYNEFLFLCQWNRVHTDRSRLSEFNIEEQSLRN